MAAAGHLESRQKPRTDGIASQTKAGPSQRGARCSSMSERDRRREKAKIKIRPPLTNNNLGLGRKTLQEQKKASDS